MSIDSTKCNRKITRIPPDLEQQNNDRANWARAAVEEFITATGVDPCDAIADLIADLMHLCDRDGDYQKFSEALRLGRANYKEETRHE